MFKNNPDLYPTPDHLIAKMLSKVDFETDKEYNRSGNELAINTKNVLMLGM